MTKQRNAIERMTKEVVNPDETRRRADVERTRSEQPSLSREERTAAIRAGKADPTPSVRAAFERVREPEPEEGADVEEGYEGPFRVVSRFRYLSADVDPKTGKRVEVRIEHRMPCPKTGKMIPRILQAGDIPDEIAQQMWLDGVLEPAPAPKPKPKLRRV